MVSEWKDFRPQYNELRILRSRIPAQIPVLGVSATLDPQTLDWVRMSAGFDSDVEIIRSSIDRPEIYFQVSRIDESQRSMLNLQSILPKAVARFSDVPKTIVYMDSIAQICKADLLFREWMRRLEYPAESLGWVAPYFSDMADSDKRKIDVDFRRRHNECSSPRIILTTDAYGLGVDNPDVKLVVQWLLPQSIQRLYQRMGRAMRCGSGKATFILMYQPWCEGVRSKQSPQKDRSRPAAAPSVAAADNAHSDISDSEVEDDVQQDSIRRRGPDRRRNMSAGLFDIINADSGDCVREIGLRFFDDDTYSQQTEKPQPCCSNCDPDSRYSIAPHPILTPKATADSLRRPWFQKTLSDWRASAAAALAQECGIAIPESVVMSDSYLALLAKWGSDIKNCESMLRFAGPWTEVATYGEEVLKILHTGQSMSPEDSDGPIFQHWVGNNNSTRQRRRFQVPQTVASKSEDALREERRDAWLLQKGLLPANKPRTRAARRGSANRDQLLELNSCRIESAQRELPQRANAREQTVVELHNLASVTFQQPTSAPQAPPLASESQALRAPPDSQRRKRKWPANS